MITNASSEQIVNAIAAANKNFGGNIKIKKIKPAGKRFNFTLTVNNSKNRGGRISPSGRRVAALCFHGHYGVIAELLKNPCYIKSCHARYNSLQDLESVAPVVGNKNIGSQFNYLALEDACNCSKFE